MRRGEMRSKTSRSHWPSWLRRAKTVDAQVRITDDGRVVWLSGIWLDGTWLDGIWHGGTWLDGEWHSGVWHAGEWISGLWRSGDWHSGTWHSGTWHGGTWHGGRWQGGTWHASEDRLRYMASLAGLAWDGTHYIGYQTTQGDGRGRFTRSFIQTEGEYYESNLPPSGAGTCVAGIHITSAARAWTYFGGNPDAQLWEVRVRPDDLFDCDGERARIRGGVFRKIERPF